MNPKDTQYFGTSLKDFVDNFPEVAHVKRTSDFTYVLSNQHNLNILGLDNLNDLIGKSIFDIAKKMKGRWPDDYAQRTHEMDLEVVSTKETLTKTNEVYLNHQGFISTHHVMKHPIYNSKGDMKYILTLVFNISKNESLANIRKKYHQYYPSVKLADEMFLKFVGINGANRLTKRELDCLIAIVQYKNIKPVASQLNVSPNTVETHLKHVRAKLGLVTTNDVIDYFRSFVS